jgi:hypothetical protein
MQTATGCPDGSGTARAAAATVPGPADREHFFAAQARNRRAAWRLTAHAALGVALMGVPMSAVISPLAYAAVIVLNDLVSLVLPTADLLHLLAHVDQQPGASALPDALLGVILVAALVIPGSLVMLLAWLGARALFLSGGAEALPRRPRASLRRPRGAAAPEPGRGDGHRGGRAAAPGRDPRRRRGQRRRGRLRAG